MLLLSSLKFRPSTVTLTMERRFHDPENDEGERQGTQKEGGGGGKGHEYIPCSCLIHEPFDHTNRSRHRIKV